MTDVRPLLDTDALEQAGDDDALIELGIHRLVVPTPFGVGPVNAYLLEGPPLTLIDSGPNLATSMAILEQLIADTGHSTQELELLLITHTHADHLGLTGLLATRNQAPVACLDVARGFVENIEAELRCDDDFAADLMRRHGVQGEIVDVLRSIAVFSRSLAASARVDVCIADGTSIRAGARELQVQHRPGHSSFDTLFADTERRVLFAGDHLLSRISSNALVTRAPDNSGERSRPLIAYRRSLQATRELEIDLVAGGHGPTIYDHRALIDRRLSEQTERAERIHGILRPGPLTAHEIANCIWGQIAFTQTFLTLSKVLGHLDLLLEDGLATEEDQGDIVRFSAT